MERKVGRLGLAPIEAIGYSHNGSPGSCGGPEYYLADKINLNIVYSVYDSPKTVEGIAEEMGMTPVYLKERIEYLAANGFLTELKGKKYTTYVRFMAPKISLELEETILKKQLAAAKTLVEHYVPQVRKALEGFTQVYIPSGNRELFEAAAIFYGILEKCSLSIQKNLSRYRIRALDGGDYFATVYLKPEIEDPEYRPTLTDIRDYGVCGAMTRVSEKYPSVCSWSVDSRFCSRLGGWQENLASDYDAVYEMMKGTISNTVTHAEKYKRMRHRNYITQDGRVNIMVVGCRMEEFAAMLPGPEQSLLDAFAGFALEQGMMMAKRFPPQMQDFVVADFVSDFIGSTIAMMVMDRLYDEHIFRMPSAEEKATAHLLMFSDVLP